MDMSCIVSRPVWMKIICVVGVIYNRINTQRGNVPLFPLRLTGRLVSFLLINIINTLVSVYRIVLCYSTRNNSAFNISIVHLCHE